MTLKDLKVGESAVVKGVGGEGVLRQHFLDMGLIPGTEVRLVKMAPMGDPIEIKIHGYALTLRLSEALKIEVDADGARETGPAAPLDEDFGYNLSLHEHNAHPGFGEEGRYHSKDDGNPLPKDEILTFALAGQQNCGKTTLFNQLTGSNQHVGNFPGVTVSRKDGVIKGYPNTRVTDLPGRYSMPTTSSATCISPCNSWRWTSPSSWPLI